MLADVILTLTFLCIGALKVWQIWTAVCSWSDWLLDELYPPPRPKKKG